MWCPISLLAVSLTTLLTVADYNIDSRFGVNWGAVQIADFIFYHGLQSLRPDKTDAKSIFILSEIHICLLAPKGVAQHYDVLARGGVKSVGYI
jgi:hypothetical protein